MPLSQQLSVNTIFVLVYLSLFAKASMASAMRAKKKAIRLMKVYATPSSVPPKKTSVTITLRATISQALLVPKKYHNLLKEFITHIIPRLSLNTVPNPASNTQITAFYQANAIRHTFRRCCSVAATRTYSLLSACIFLNVSLVLGCWSIFAKRHIHSPCIMCTFLFCIIST